MKAKRKLITDRPQITDSEIIKHKKPFDELIKTYNAGGGSGSAGASGLKALSSYFGWGAGIIGALAVAATIYFSEFSPSESPKEEVVVQQNDSLTLEGNDSTTTPLRKINPPYPELVKYEYFNVKNNRRPVTITTKNGTVIKIPANAFVDSTGKRIHKNIVIKYRDFYDPVDFFLSGIPMDYDSAGTNYTFSSAGMFEISAVSKDKNLYLTEGKVIELEFVSQYDDAYNFYKYDTVTNKWEFRYKEDKSDLEIINTDQAVAKEETTAETEGDSLLNTAEETGGLSITANDIVEERKCENIIRQVEKGVIKVGDKGGYCFPAKGLVDEKTSLGLIDDSLVFKIKEGQNFSGSYFSVVWDTVYLLRKAGGDTVNKFYIYLKRNSAVYSYEVEPVINQEYYSSAKREYRKLTAARKARITAARKRQKKVTVATNSLKSWTVRRKVQIIDLGLYNHDTPLPRPLNAAKGPVTIFADNGKPLYYKNIFVTQPEKNVLWKYDKRWYYSSSLKNIGWIVTGDGKLAIIYPENFTGKSPGNKITAKVYDVKRGLAILNRMI